MVMKEIYTVHERKEDVASAKILVATALSVI
jgi:hypothetical protein